MRNTRPPETSWHSAEYCSKPACVARFASYFIMLSPGSAIYSLHLEAAWWYDLTLNRVFGTTKLLCKAPAASLERGLGTG